MSPIIIVFVIILLGIALVGVGVGLSRRSERETRRIAQSMGIPTREDLPPLPTTLDVPPISEWTAEPVEPAEPADAEQPDTRAAEVVEEVATVDVPPQTTKARLRNRLGKTRAILGAWRKSALLDDDTWDELEESLLLADVGLAVAQSVLESVRSAASAARVDHPAVVLDLLKAELVKRLEVEDRSLRLAEGEPNVWLFVGVNGVGKTTTIAKLAQREVAAGRSVVLAAADTFRAAAAEQLVHWAGKVGADVVRGAEGADPGSVVFDAMSAAANREADLVMVDTAGRLHSNVNLMAELEKIRRIIDRTPGACKEVLLVLDASTGQNGLAQAKQFLESVDVTGVVLTKLDGTAKGGIVMAIQSELGIPVKVVGVGETADDLIPFDPQEFIDALFE